MTLSGWCSPGPPHSIPPHRKCKVAWCECECHEKVRVPGEGALQAVADVAMDMMFGIDRTLCKLQGGK